MSEEKKVKSKEDIRKEKVYLYGGIAFVVLSVIAVATGDGSKSRSEKEVDVSVFSDEAAKKKAAHPKKVVPRDILTEEDPDAGMIVGVPVAQKKVSSVIEESIGMSEEELKEHLARQKPEEEGEPYQIIASLTGVEEEAAPKPKSKEKSNEEAKESECRSVSRPHGMALVSDGSMIRRNDVRTKWTSKNETQNHVAIIVVQDKKEVGVVFLPPGGEYESSVAATHLTFLAKQGDRKCVDWKERGGSKSSLPLMTERVDKKKVEKGDFYEGTKFTTVVSEENGKITSKTSAM